VRRPQEILQQLRLRLLLLQLLLLLRLLLPRPKSKASQLTCALFSLQVIDNDCSRSLFSYLVTTVRRVTNVQLVDGEAVAEEFVRVHVCANDGRFCTKTVLCSVPPGAPVVSPDQPLSGKSVDSAVGAGITGCVAAGAAGNDAMTDLVQAVPESDEGDGVVCDPLYMRQSTDTQLTGQCLVLPGEAVATSAESKLAQLSSTASAAAPTAAAKPTIAERRAFCAFVVDAIRACHPGHALGRGEAGVEAPAGVQLWTETGAEVLVVGDVIRTADANGCVVLSVSASEAFIPQAVIGETQDDAIML
jgi:hypothetical protein